jgi:hypothetical protein
MKFLFVCLSLSIIALLTSPLSGSAQPRQVAPATTTKADTSTTLRSETAATQKSDDEFNLFLFAYLIAFSSMVVGAVIVGSIAVTLLLLALFFLVSGGILSAGILVGLYKRSVSAGFKAFLMIIGGLGGLVAGVVAFWLGNHLFHFHLAQSSGFLLGAAGGLVGGLLCGVITFHVIRAFSQYCRQKLSLRL